MKTDEETMTTEAQLLFDARQLLLHALEDKGINITGCGFGIGQADIDIKVGDRNFCITLTLSDLDRRDEELELEEQT